MPVSQEKEVQMTRCPIKRLIRATGFRLTLSFDRILRILTRKPATPLTATVSMPSGKTLPSPPVSPSGAAAGGVELAGLEQAFGILLKAVSKNLNTDELRRILKKFQPVAYDKYFQIERIDEAYDRPALPTLHLPITADISTNLQVLLLQVQEAISEFTLAAKRFDERGLPNQTIRQFLEGILIVLEEIRGRLQSHLDGPGKGATDEQQ
jgi:hypothetical protein